MKKEIVTGSTGAEQKEKAPPRCAAIVALRDFLSHHWLDMLLIWLYSLLPLLSLFGKTVDWDTASEVTMARWQDTLGQINVFAILRPLVLITLNHFAEPLWLAVALTIGASAVTGILLFAIVLHWTHERWLARGAVVLFYLNSSIMATTFSIDDNLLPLPCAIGSFYLLYTSAPYTYKRLYGAGCLLSLAMAWHSQYLTLVPVFLGTYAAIQWKTGRPFRRRLAYQTAVLLAGCLTIFVPLFLTILAAKNMLTWEMLSHPLSIFGYGTNPEWSYLAQPRTWDGSVRWVILWFLALCGFNSPVLPALPALDANVTGLTLVGLLLGGVWLAILVGLPLTSWQRQTPQCRIILLSNFAILGITAAFTFLFDPSSWERWTQAVPFVIINVWLAVKTWNKYPQFAQNLPHLHIGSLAPKQIGATLLISSIIMSGSLVTLGVTYRQSAPMQDFWELVAAPDDQALVMADYGSTALLSYYRGATVFYLDVEPMRWTAGKPQPCNYTEILTWNHSFLLVTYDAISKLQAYANNTLTFSRCPDYRVAVYRIL